MKTTLHMGRADYQVEYTQSGDEYNASVNGTPLRTHLLAARSGALTLLIDGKSLRVHLANDGSRTLVAIEGQTYEFTRQEKQGRARPGETFSRVSPEVRSPMPGKILTVLVTEGTEIEDGQALVLLEAMKMENTLTAEGAARVKKVHVSAGDLVDLGQLLVELDFIDLTDASSQES
jgi:acetyl/propionyl-CoA carboxylase alpha subunit